METLLIAGRALHLAGTLSLGGGLAFRALVLPGTAPTGLRRLEWLGLAAAVAGLALWLGIQAWSLGEGENVGGMLVLLVERTWFGHVMTARLVLQVVGCVTVRWPWPAAAAGLAAVALQGAIGHGAAMDGFGWLAISGGLHPLAAALWLGGLLPLLLVLRAAPRGEAIRALIGFSRLGMVAVGAVAVTAAAQGSVLLDSLAGAIGTPYGRLAMGKVGGFSVLLVLASVNRWRLGPRFGDAAARRWLYASIAAEIGLGLGVVGLAATMASGLPAMHDEPVWPFALRLSWDAWAEPELRGEIAAGLAGVGLGLALLAVAAARRRWRIAGALAGLLLLRIGLPHLDLLLVPAFPTSYAHSTGGTPESVARGAVLFAARCVACHGAEGRGDGPEAGKQPVPPADLTAAHLLDHPEGDLFWWITHGMIGPDGTPSMPAIGADLSDDDAWALVDYIRSRNPYLGQAPVPMVMHHH
jgi:putative copper export protein/mono/diheme cytochrome c family protein